jgi:hypothetical protein
MDLTELRIALADLGVRSDAFAINGVGNTEEQYRLEGDGNSWTVYYYERGQSIEPRYFSTESEACCYLLNLLKRDPTTRRTARLVRY